MGKASRWMMNLLLGKKGKNKIKEAPASFSEESMNSPAAVSPATPARWSFGMSFRKEKWRASHQKGSRSLDLISSFAALDLDYKGNRNMVSKAADVSLPTTQEAKGISQAREIAAATKIQAFYRSYLARKALRALRGLVKLQAVVRGHLVRKQTAAIIRQMQALMAIQVRARFQRIQMAESSQLVAKSQSLRYRIVTPEKGSKRVHRETLDMNPYENFGALKSRKDSRKHTEDEKTEHRFSCYSADLSGFCRVGDQHNQVSSFTTANKSARLCPPTRQQIPGRASFSYLLQQDNSLIPNYMAKTESCRAKSRSQSEPKKRPKSKEKPKSKRTPSFDGINFVDRQPSYSSNADEATFESLGPRFAKLYRPRRNLKDDGSSRNGNPNFWE